MNKITFSITTDEAKHISTAISLLFTRCINATAEKPDGINQLNCGKKQLDKLANFGRYIDAEIYLATKPETTLNPKP